MSIKRKIKNRLNSVVKHSEWYCQDMFGDCIKFWRHNTYNLDLVNLGSGSAKYGFDYSEIDLRTANWAMSPQTLVGDYAILSNYLSFLKSDHAVVIISICPFSCLDDGKSYLPDKMYTIVDVLSIPDFAVERKAYISDIQNNPLNYFPLVSVFKEIKHFIYKVNKSCMSESEFQVNAEVYINAWKKQFSLYQLSDEFSLVNKDRFDFSVNALDSLVKLCISHNFIPVIVLPPVTKYLNSYFDNNFIQRFIIDYVKSISNKYVPFLNYLNDSEFSDDNLFINANFLNVVGAKKFTHRVVNDLKAMNII